MSHLFKKITMVIACHFTFSAYGFWPPNDDRGSWSTHIWARHLQRFGDAKTVTTRRSIAHHSHDRAKNQAIRNALERPPVRFNPAQWRVIRLAFAETVRLMALAIHALAVMPDHVHVVMSKHAERFEEVTGRLKRSASTALTKSGLHPFYNPASPNRTPTPWAEGGWKRFCFEAHDVASAVDYVNGNPERRGCQNSTIRLSSRISDGKDAGRQVT